MVNAATCPSTHAEPHRGGTALSSETYAHREAAIDVAVLFAMQGIQWVISTPETADRGIDLSAKLEWALQTLGVTLAEVKASTIRIRALHDSLHLDAEIDKLLGGGE